MKTKCLLIGGCGFIGSHLSRKLTMLDRSVTVLDRRNPPEKERMNDISYISGDFSNAKLMEQLVSEHDEIIHLAYATTPNTSFYNLLADLDQNLHPAIHLFEAVARKGAKLLLVSSGGTVYGEAISAPISENHPTQPISPYGITKLTLEKYAFLYAVTKGLQVVCVRPSNPYGEGQLPFIGQGFISTAMATVLQGDEVTIFGKSGTIRDYIYIDDLVNGMVVALDKGKINEVYNIGSGSGLSNFQIINEFRPLFERSGVDINVCHAPERPFDVKVNILNSQKLHSLGWMPATSINNGLERTLDWLKIIQSNKKKLL